MPANSVNELRRTISISPIGKSLRIAIANVITAAGDAPLEARLVSAFTALEAIVNALGELDKSAYALATNKFEKLSSELRRVVREHCASKGYPETVPEAINKKMGELRRRAIVDRITEVLIARRISWMNEQSDATTLAERLRWAYKIRNDLIHQGNASDVDISWGVWHAIHDLAERLIYFQLGFDPQWLRGDPYAPGSPIPEHRIASYKGS
jgi:hypothetical protein